MYSIENEYLKISAISKGAELSSIYSKYTNMEHLWEANPAYWAKKSPVLFPIVGSLKDNTYYYDNKSYQLTRHGFARDMDFTLTAQTNTSLTFTLESNDETLSKFPFEFILNIIYTIEASALFVKYQVINKGNDDMYFSIGAHPAFKIPLEKHVDFSDYYFEFSNEENALRWPISGEGLINPDAYPLLINSKKLAVSREFFSKDAIVFKHLNSDLIQLKSDKSAHGIELFFPKFPYLGLWSAKDADFICIEPWCGIADSTITNQELINKEGINFLTAGSDFERQWSVRIF